MLTRMALRSVRSPLRQMSTSACRLAQTPTQAAHELPKGTVEPGSKVDPQLGDYPAMPLDNQQFRPYSKKWWDPQDRRQFGETLHEQDDVLSMWSPDAYKTPGPVALRHFLMAVAGIAGFSYIIYVSQPEAPMLRKTFPRDGLASELGGSFARARTEADVLSADQDEEQDSDDEDDA
ncbi:hypothetical protein MYAM1_002862 [Malassezia yamatoensis]|uniref:Uncharacterized protein n=1 Tax=Malassezia yamatoensis TaxID=253288 RepID=A0AAJ5YVD9_9BASI|nr:hypothetical protein MYAM1_002862 [Malassezia yamatoensis]